MSLKTSPAGGQDRAFTFSFTLQVLDLTAKRMACFCEMVVKVYLRD